MDPDGSTVGTQRSSRARTEQCPATEGSPGADRLSVLSDELLLHILSSLEIREAVSTSCLSRRWRYLYHQLSCLDFSSEVWDSASAWFIDRVLLLHAAPRIEAFYLSMRVSGEDSVACRKIDSRLLFAVSRDVRVLDLDIQEPYDPYDGRTDEVGYGLPPWVFHCGTLEDFSVRNCRLLLSPHIRLPSLKKMCLSLVEFQHDELKRLLLGCPLLQSLKLVHCNRESDLVIDARENPKLEVLVIVDGTKDDQEFHSMTMQIVAPSVKHLRFEGAALRRRYKVRDLSSLAAANFHLDENRDVDEDEAKVFSTGLLRRVRHVRELKLSWWSLQALHKREMRDDWASAFPIVTTLKLRIELHEEKMVAILSALRACNKLRTLVLSIRPTYITAYDRSFSDWTKKQLACFSGTVMQDLKTIMLCDLVRCDEDLEEEGSQWQAQKRETEIVLIGFLLKVSPVLEKLIVQPSWCMKRMKRKWELLFNLSSDLHSLPRASPDAKALSKRELRGNLVSALSNVTRLELTIELEEPQLQAILSALHACSNLRALVLSILRHMKTLDRNASDETEIPQSLALDSDIVMQDLKRIVIQGLMSYYNQNAAGKGGGVEEDFVAKRKGNCIVFIGFLLRVSPVLEELIVQPSKGMNKMTRKWELLSNLYSDLLALPRASSCAKVIIDGK